MRTNKKKIFMFMFLVELADSLPGSTQRSPYPTRRRKGTLTLIVYGFFIVTIFYHSSPNLNQRSPLFLSFSFLCCAQ